MRFLNNFLAGSRSTEQQSLYGLSKFTTGNFYETPAGGSEIGTGNGFGASVMFVLNKFPASAEVMYHRMADGDNGGWLFQLAGSGNSLRFCVYNNSGVMVASPLYYYVPSDLGKVIIAHGIHDGASVRLRVNDREIGTPTAVTGYTSASTSSRIGKWKVVSMATASSTILAGATWQGQPTPAQLTAYSFSARSLGDFPATFPEVTSQDSNIVGLAPLHWYRADNCTLSGSNLATLPNKGAAGGAMNVFSGTLAKPTMDSALNYAPTIAFTGTQGLQSTLSASEFRYLHDGTGAETWCVYVPTAASTSKSVWSTRAFQGHAEIGSGQYYNATNISSYIGNGTASISSSAVPGIVTNAPTYSTQVYKTGSGPEAASSVKESYIQVATAPVTPVSTDPQYTFRIGYNTIVATDMRFAEFLSFNRVLTLSERRQVQEYIQDRYGIAASVATAADKTVQQLNPRHWFRPDSNTLSGANLSSLVNRGSYLGGTMTVAAGTVAAPAPDTTFGGAPTLNFGGTQRLVSAQAASEFKYLHDGTGSEVFLVFSSQTTATGSFPLTTHSTASGAGFDLNVNAACTSCAMVVRASAGNDPISRSSVAGALAPDGAARVSNTSYGSGLGPDAFNTLNNLTINATQSVAPSSSNPETTLYVGLSNGMLVGKIADILIFNRRLLPHERQQVREYIQTRYGITSPVATPDDKVVQQLNPRHWYRPDSNILSGANLTSLTNRGAYVGAAMNVTGTLAAPAADTGLGGAPSLTFSGTQWAVSTLPGSEFQFLHDGSAYDGFLVGLSTSDAVSIMLATQSGGSGTGMQLDTTAGQATYTVRAGASLVVNPSVAVAAKAFPNNAAGYCEFSYYEGVTPEWFISTTGNTVKAGASDNPPSASGPSATLYLGAQGGGGVPMNMRFADLILFNRRLTIYERQQVLEYIQRRYGIQAPVASISDKTIQQFNPRHWYRADTNTLSGGNLSTLVNRGSAVGSSMAVSGTIAAPAADPNLNNAPSISPNGKYLFSTAAASTEFKYLHDGTGCDVFTVITPSAVGLTGTFQNIWGTTDQASGTETGTYCRLRYTSALIDYVVGNGSAAVISTNGWAHGQTAYVLRNSYKESTAVPAAYMFSGVGKGVVNTSSGVPSTSDPLRLFRIGATGSAAYSFLGQIAEVLMFDRRLSPYEAQQVYEYVQERYGIAAPVVSAEDRKIMQLNPFSWIRSDYYSSSGGKVTAFLDKVLPGHSLTQGTSANQVAEPSADSLMLNQAVVSFAGNQYYSSSLPIAAWTFMHSGSGVDAILVLRVVSSNSGVLLSTRSGSTGFTLYTGASARGAYVGNGASNVVNHTAYPISPSNTTSYFRLMYNSSTTPQWRHYDKFFTLGSGAQSTAPSSGLAEATLRLGANTGGGQASTFTFADLLIFDKTLTPAEILTVNNYLIKKYGVT